MIIITIAIIIIVIKYSADNVSVPSPTHPRCAHTEFNIGECAIGRHVFLTFAMHHIWNGFDHMLRILCHTSHVTRHMQLVTRFS
jgi:hypothetical protein